MSVDLKEPVQPTQKLIAIYLRHKKDYKIDRTYQRAPGAWSKKQEQYFIDSILRGYSIPMIFIHKKDGENWVVDGQHRLQTIKKFANNNLELRDNYSKDIIKKSSGGKVYENLSENYQERFDEYPLPIVQLKEYTDEDIRSLFKRLQSGTSLSVGEKLNAYPGQIVPTMRKLGKTKFFKSILPFSMKRYRNYKLAANFLFLESMGITSLNASEIYDFFERYKDLDQSSNEYKKVNKVLNYLTKILDENMAELRNQAWTITIYLFISQLFKKKYTVKKKENEIRQFIIDFYDSVQKSDTVIDKELIEFEKETSRGTTGKKSIELRHSIILDRFFSEYEIDAKDDKRLFTDNQKRKIFRRDDEKCQICNKDLTFGKRETHYHHKKLWSKGGSTTIENGILVCENCHLKKIHGK